MNHGRALIMVPGSALAGLALTIGMASPAHAAQGFALDTSQRGINDGSTHARGSVTFTGARSFTISSSVWDSCPGDGRGAYLAYSIKFTDGSGWGAYSVDAFNRDTNGCDNGKITKTVTRTYSKKIRSIQLALFESDGVDRGAYQWDYSTTKDNPNT